MCLHRHTRTSTELGAVPHAPPPALLEALNNFYANAPVAAVTKQDDQVAEPIPASSSDSGNTSDSDDANPVAVVDASAWDIDAQLEPPAPLHIAAPAAGTQPSEINGPVPADSDIETDSSDGVEDL